MNSACVDALHDRSRMTHQTASLVFSRSPIDFPRLSSNRRDVICCRTHPISYGKPPRRSYDATLEQLSTRQHAPHNPGNSGKVERLAKAGDVRSTRIEESQKGRDSSAKHGGGSVRDALSDPSSARVSCMDPRSIPRQNRHNGRDIRPRRDPRREIQTRRVGSPDPIERAGGTGGANGGWHWWARTEGWHWWLVHQCSVALTSAVRWSRDLQTADATVDCPRFVDRFLLMMPVLIAFTLIAFTCAERYGVDRLALVALPGTLTTA
jgi:hypothetical protein